MQMIPIFLGVVFSVVTADIGDDFASNGFKKIVQNSEVVLQKNEGIDDTPPHFREDYRPSVSQEEDPPLKVVELFADDPDLIPPTKPWFKFQMDANAELYLKKSFRVVYNKDGDEGRGSATVYTRVKLYRDNQEEYHLPIVITDSGMPPLSSTKTLTVTIVE